MSVRTLGFWEATCQEYHRHFRCSGMVLQYARICGPLSEPLARQSLRWLQQRHPLLHAEFANHDSDYNKFDFSHYEGLSDEAKLDEVPLKISIRESEEQWQEVSEQELATDFAEGSKYLWRAHILLGDGIHDCIFIFHHSISDGPSNAHFVRDFLNYAKDLHAGESKPIGFAEEPVLPPVERMIPTAKSDTETQVKSDLVQAERDTSQPLTSWEFETDAPLAERKTRNFYYTISPERLERLKANTKKRGITINSVLMAAIMDAVLNKPGTHHSAFGTAISLRNYCEPPVGREHFGCYVMVVTTIHKIGEGVDLWELAKDCHEGLRAEIELKHSQGFMTPAYKKDEVASTLINALTTTNQGKFFPGGPVISNIGVLDFPVAYGPFSLGPMYFSTTQNAGNFNFLTWITTHNDRVYCCLTYTEGLYTRSFAESVLDKYAKNIESACE